MKQANGRASKQTSKRS